MHEVTKDTTMKNMKMKTNLLAALVAVAFISPMASLHAETMTNLKQMVEKVITSNPEVQAKYHEYTAAGYEKDVAWGNYLPKADVTGTYRVQEDMGTSATRRAGTAIPKFDSDLLIRQMLFDGFQTPNEVARMEHAQRVRYFELQNVMQNTTLDFVRNYVDILRFRDMANFAKENYAFHKQYASKIKQRVDAGVARRVDLEQAQGRLALAEANLLTEATNLHDATARIQRVLGSLPPKTLEKLNLDQTAIDGSAVQALKLAYAGNPSLMAAIEDIQASEKSIKAKEAKYLPRFDLQLRKNIDTTNDGRNSAYAADAMELMMNYNIFNGLSDKAAVNQAVELLERSNDLRDKACIDTRQVVTIAYNDIKQLRNQLEYRAQHRGSIESAREAYQKQFDIGQRTLLDLLDTENEYFQARRAEANVGYDMQTAFARLFAGQGQLLNKLNVVRQGLPDLAPAEYANAANVCEAIAPEQEEFSKEFYVAQTKAAALPLIESAPIKQSYTCSADSITSRLSDKCSTEVVTAQLNNWLTAWREKDFENYLNYYSPRFAPEAPTTKSGWVTQRKSDVVTTGRVNVGMRDLKVDCVGDKAIATFTQDYSVTSYKLVKPKDDVGCAACNTKRVASRSRESTLRKEVHFERVNNQWKIVKEIVLR